MEKNLEMKEIESAMEGILFASGEPVAIDRICLALDIDRATAELVLQKLSDYYSYERRGIRLVRMEENYQLCSAPEYADVIRRAFEIRKPAKLSQPALEVLAIIAYYQPTTRAYVDQVRGVDTSSRSAGGCRCRGVRGCTARRRRSCARSTSILSRICPRCPVWRRTGSCALRSRTARRSPKNKAHFTGRREEESH